MIRARRCGHVWRAARAALSAVCLFLIDPQLAAAESLKGVALAIGQSDYETLKDLPNTLRDADAIKLLLSELGFDANVTSERDAKRLRRDLDIFMDDASEADVAVLYYAGHAVEIGGENFLVPIDIHASSLATLGEKLISLTDYIDRLRQKAQITIVFLDACRNNPFPPGAMVKLSPESAPAALGAGGLQSRSIVVLGSETRRADEGFGTVIAFAAEPGKVALDGDASGNSPYAAAILRHLPAMTGEEFGTVMRMVTEEVYLKTGGKQRPWISESLRRLLYFGEAAPDTIGDEGDILKERRRLLLTIADLPDAKRLQVERVASQGGVPMDAVYGMLNAMGSEVPQDQAELEKVLRSQAERLKQILAERAVLTEADSEIQRLSRLAAEAVDEGALQTALALNERAKARVGELEPSLRKAETNLRARWTEASAVYARSAQAYEVAFELRKAAEDYATAFSMIERWDDVLAWRYKSAQAYVLKDHGVYSGDRTALEQAVALNREALALAARMGAPDLWTDSVNYLGTALAVLGEREDRPDRLHEAVSTYRAALQRLDPKRMPVQWRQLQNNLANALSELGSREADASLLEEAAAAYEELLHELPREIDPEQWSIAQSNLASTLMTLGSRETGTARIEKALVIFRSLLQDVSRESDPISWALRQSNLAGALITLGQRKADSGLLEEAVVALRATLQVYTRERMPQDWAATHYNLASALREIGKREPGIVRLEEAVAANRMALEEWTRERAPYNWAQTHNNLGNLMTELSRRLADPARTEEAAAHYRAALQVMTREAAPLEWARLQSNLANALADAGRHRGEPALLEQAVERYRTSLEEITRQRLPLEWARIQYNIGIALSELGKNQNGDKHLEEALTVFEAALQEWTREIAPLRWADAQDALANAAFQLAQREKGSARLEAAVSAKTAALDVVTRETAPVRWAQLRADTGTLLSMLGERSRGAARTRLWEEAIAAWREAQTVQSRRADAEGWAALQDNIGYQLILLGEEENNLKRFEESLPILRSVPEARGINLADDPLVSAQVCRALYGIGSRRKDRAMLSQAKGLCLSGAAGLEQRGESSNAAITGGTLVKIEEALATLQ